MMFLLGSMSRSRSQCEQSDFFFFFFWELAISFLCFWPTNFLPDTQKKWCFCLVRWFDHVHNVSNQIFFFLLLLGACNQLPMFLAHKFLPDTPKQITAKKQEKEKKSQTYEWSEFMTNWRVTFVYLSIIPNNWKIYCRESCNRVVLFDFPTQERTYVQNSLPTCPKKKKEKKERNLSSTHLTIFISIH